LHDLSNFREGFPQAADNTPAAEPRLSSGMNQECANWSERAVRDAVLSGDMAAWRAWYAQHFGQLADYARWRCGGLADVADDVIQETWLTAVRRLRTFDPEKGPFAAWLRGIAANAAHNCLRARCRERKRQRPLHSGEDLPAATADPLAVEKAERVALALGALPDHYEAVLRAKYLDQLTVEQIATQSNTSPKAVESLLTRARQAFREAYEIRSDE
jgi:RNA polymerase sigma-70 factor (ECF subfamily)